MNTHRNRNDGCLDGYPQPHDHLYDGHRVWEIDDHGDGGGILIDTHGPTARAVIAAYCARLDPALRTSLADPYTATDTAVTAADATVTERWVLFATTCGCTDTEHDAHQDIVDGVPVDCADTDCAVPGLPPCTTTTEAFEWAFKRVDKDEPGAVPVTEVLW